MGRCVPLRCRSPWVNRLAIALGLIGLYATLVEPEMVQRHDHAFAPSSPSPPWPAACRGVRLAVASDLHIGDPHMHAARLARIRADLAAARPDAILIPGDFVAHVIGGQTLPMETIASRIADWPRIAPVVAVLGNHDYSVSPPHLSIAALQRHGFTVLDNRSYPLDLRGGRCRLWIAGVADGFSGLDSVRASMEGIPAAEPVIVLSHDARVVDRTEPSRVAWLIAGHTHGGVLCIPGTRQCLSKFHPWTKGWVRGWYHLPNRPSVLVSSGLGNSILPVRFGAPPGWDLVTLVEPATPDSP